MRLTEFRIPKTDRFSSELDVLRQTILEYRGKLLPIKESFDDTQAIEEYRKFIAQFITDPEQLSIGDVYYPIQLISRPLAKSIDVEYIETPIQFKGSHNDCFIFSNKTTQFNLPVHIDVDSEYGPYLITTTVYTTLKEVNQFIVMLGLQFAGRWKIKQKKIRI
jgi:hypothetical protein